MKELRIDRKSILFRVSLTIISCRNRAMIAYLWATTALNWALPAVLAPEPYRAGMAMWIAGALLFLAVAVLCLVDRRKGNNTNGAVAVTWIIHFAIALVLSWLVSWLFAGLAAAEEIAMVLAVAAARTVIRSRPSARLSQRKEHRP